MQKKITIEGDVTNVGYRPFLLAKALRLRIPNFDAENIEENDVQKVVVSVVGEEEQISEFEKFVNNNVPEIAKVSKVSIEEGLSEKVMSIEDYRRLLNSEQLSNIIQGGLQLRNDTNQNFKHMDEKYDAISKAMFKLVDKIEERNKLFESRIEKTEKYIEKTEKNIETLLNILARGKI